MLIIYVLLSPTFGMHQYTAHLLHTTQSALRHDVLLVTTTTCPRDRYDPAARIVTPITAHGTGFSPEGLDLAQYRQVYRALTSERFNVPTFQRSNVSTFQRSNVSTFQRSNVPTFQRLNVPSLVHFTGVHLWNLPLVYALRRRGARVIHTLHDLHPHGGVRHAGLIRLWNRLIIASGAQIVVHGRCFRDELLARGLPPDRVTYLPLLHGFWKADAGGRILDTGSRMLDTGSRMLDTGSRMLDTGSRMLDTGCWKQEDGLRNTEYGIRTTEYATRNPQSAISNPQSPIRNPQHLHLRCAPAQVQVSPIRNPPMVLFFGRVEPYKGADVLLDAWGRARGDLGGARLVIAGPGARGLTLPPLPPDVERRDRLIGDEEGLDLFRRASLLVLPYRDATQSALIAAAYAFALPVIVTRAGALPEYVVEGETGWVVPPGDAAALADALRTALADGRRLEAMGQAGRRWYEEQHREERAALAALYAEVPRSTL